VGITVLPMLTQLCPRPGHDSDTGSLEPYDLSDDEEDLRPVATPRYLRRIMERKYCENS
jgi:hypothetical protein